jgi:predicted dehydrogenase
VNLYKAQIEDVSDAIRQDRQPLCAAEAGLWSQRVLAACYESSRLDRAVNVA